MSATSRPVPLPTSVDQATIQQVFDLMVQLLGTQYSNANATVSEAAGGENCTMALSDSFGSGYTINTRLAGPRVGITPVGASLGKDETQRFTAKVTDNKGNDITAGSTPEWSLIGEIHGSISGTGAVAFYTAPSVIAAQAFDTVQCLDT